MGLASNHRILPLFRPGLTLIALVVVMACSNDPSAPSWNIEFSDQQRVNMIGYNGNAMEPFLSRDGGILFFNNLNAAPENTNLHWSTRVDDLTFTYQGEISGVNTNSLEGVATADESGVLYFVSTRSYDQTLSTIYSGAFNAGTVSGVVLIEGLSKNIPGWLNFDVEVDLSGTQLYVSDGRFDASGGPYEADIVLAEKTANGFTRLTNNYFENVNTGELEYAACISRNNLELYFTRVEAPITNTSVPQIYGTSRQSVTDPFDAPLKIKAATGVVEAPTLSPDGNRMYFHKYDNGLYAIYTVVRTTL